MLCYDKSFIVRDLNTNKYANFYNGIAKLNTRMNSALQLQLSPSVKYVRFEGNAVAAKKKLELIADCRDRNMRMIGRWKHRTYCGKFPEGELEFEAS